MEGVVEVIVEGIDAQQQQSQPDCVSSQDHKAKALVNKLKEIDVQETRAAEEFLEKEINKRVKNRIRLQKRPFWRFAGKKAQYSGLSASENDVRSEVAAELGHAKLPECYEGIKRLLWVERETVHSKALSDWGEKEKLFTKRVERKKNKVGELKNEVYQLIGFFSVFQGVVLTAVSQSNLLRCNNLWSPVFLSLLASCVTIAAVTQKLVQIADFLKTIHSEEQSLKEVISRASDLRREGKHFRFAKFFEARKQRAQKGTYFGLYSALVILSLVLFTVQEGNAGVYSTKFILAAHQSNHLDLDANATYREYILIVLPDGTRLEPFSSEDVLDYKEIVIKNNNDKVTWVGLHRGESKVKDTQNPTNPPTGTSESNPCTEIPTSDSNSKVITGTTAAAAGQSSSGIVGKIKNFFWYK